MTVGIAASPTSAAAAAAFEVASVCAALAAFVAVRQTLASLPLG